ncbi:MAG: FkbM family methyltransferase [Turicibacter sp.]|nr:FkbM family methyltransferase [Turicibacter sp.]
MKIKQILSHIFPATARAYHNISSNQSKKINQLQMTINTIAEKMQIREMQTYKLKQSHREKIVEFMCRSDFSQCVLDLMVNLDYDARNTLQILLKRFYTIKKVTKNQKLAYELTANERSMKQEIELLKRNIIRLSDEHVMVGGYVFPRKLSVREMVCFKYFFNKLKLESLAGKTIIDAGALMGDTAVVFSQLNCKEVRCFEPVHRQFQLLQKTIAYNNLSNVIAINKGLGKQAETQMFLSAMGSSRKINNQNWSNDVEEVEIIMLDDYVKENQLKVGLIKADIEGAEQDMLAGAKQTICEQKPILMISIYHNIPEDFFFIKPLIESWDLGYKFTFCKSYTKSPIYEIMLIASV